MPDKEAHMTPTLLTKVGVGGGGAAALVAAGALLVGGPATAATQAPKSVSAPQISGSAVSVPPGGHGLASVTCPAGTVVTGGGGTTSAYDILLSASFKNGNSWTLRGNYNTSDNSEVV